MGGFLAIARNEIAMFGVVLKNYCISNRKQLIKLFLISGTISLALRLLAPWAHLEKISSVFTSFPTYWGPFGGRIIPTLLIPAVFGIALLTMPSIPEQPLVVKPAHGANALRFIGLVLLIEHLAISNIYIADYYFSSMLWLIHAVVLLSLVGNKCTFTRDTALVFCAWQLAFWLLTIFDWEKYPSYTGNVHLHNQTLNVASTALGIFLVVLVLCRKTRVITYSSCLALSAVIYLGAHGMAPFMGYNLYYVIAVVGTIAFGISPDPYAYWSTLIR